MVAGACGVRPVTVFDSRDSAAGWRPRSTDRDSMRAMTPLERRRRSRGDRLAVHAAAEAVDDAGFMDGAVRPLARRHLSRCRNGRSAAQRGLLPHLDHARSRSRAKPSDAWNHFLSTPVDAVAARFGFEGPRGCIVAACSSSTIAIGRAVEAIRAGRADVALAGGADALARLTFSGFNQLRLMDPEPCRPFDRGRAGMNIGEGRRRSSCSRTPIAPDAVVPTCMPSSPATASPARRFIRRRRSRTAFRSPLSSSLALRTRGFRPMPIDHINAHGTATPQNDAAEARGFARVFGARVGKVPVTSVKSMVGHCLGAAGGVEAAVLALSIARGVIPPTIHHASTDEDVTDRRGGQRTRASSGCAAPCRRRSGSAATTRRS